MQTQTLTLRIVPEDLKKGLNAIDFTPLTLLNVALGQVYDLQAKNPQNYPPFD